MANTNIYIVVKKGSGLSFQTNCNFCGKVITVKKRNQKFCNATCRQLEYRKKKLAIEKGKAKRIKVFQDKINEIAIKMRKAAKAAKGEDLENLEDLAAKKEELITIIKSII